MTKEEEEKAKKDAEEAERAKKADADAGEKLDKLLKGLDSIGAMCDALTKRVDAMEAKEKERADAEMAKEDKAKKDAEEAARRAGDPEQLAADKAKKDAEEKEKAEKEEKERKDAEAKHEEEAKKIADSIEDLKKNMPKERTDADYAAVMDAQARADEVFQMFGQAAPRALQHEDLGSYRRRLAAKLKEHSAPWKAVDVQSIADDATFKIAESAIYADARTAALNPIDVPDGALREIARVDSATGIRTITFVGKQSFVAGFKQPARAVVRIGVRKES